MLPANASPNARMIPAMFGEEAITATSATVTMLPSRLKNCSGIGLPFPSPTLFVVTSYLCPFFEPGQSFNVHVEFVVESFDP